jgi:hypothetical protein
VNPASKRTFVTVGVAMTVAVVALAVGVLGILWLLLSQLAGD